MKDSEEFSSVLGQIREGLETQNMGAGLLPLLDQLGELWDRQAFRIERTLKDKSIAINLLNRTIEDLQGQQSYIEKTNEQLSYQKKLLEAQSQVLQENVRELELSNHELEQFSHIVSHDLRSPLRTITSYAQLLHRRYFQQLSDEADEFLDYITSGAIRMDQVLQDLLKFTQAGSRDNLKLKVDIAEIIEMVRFDLQQEIAVSNACISVGNLPHIEANPSDMIRLFQNLISNAIKFCRPGSRPEIFVSGRVEKDCWQFSVADNGIGLQEYYQEKAFMPFQRLTDMELPGTGMGLAICKKIVELNNGRIWYKPRPEGGTVFYFTLQKAKLPAEPELV
ncbi:MAG: hypothetical protein H6562_02765 [Lewinellaceae bacterium]|nr:hypothetical protein [Lewinella sp.]MCB9277811.1 hypothetical protein [Lewinellaceae bacterium]